VDARPSPSTTWEHSPELRQQFDAPYYPLRGRSEHGSTVPMESRIHFISGLPRRPSTRRRDRTRRSTPWTRSSATLVPASRLPPDCARERRSNPPPPSAQPASLYCATVWLSALDADSLSARNDESTDTHAPIPPHILRLRWSTIRSIAHRQLTRRSAGNLPARNHLCLLDRAGRRSESVGQVA
jgi:hypothetical protein